MADERLDPRELASLLEITARCVSVGEAHQIGAHIAALEAAAAELEITLRLTQAENKRLLDDEAFREDMACVIRHRDERAAQRRIFNDRAARTERIATLEVELECSNYNHDAALTLLEQERAKVAKLEAENERLRGLLAEWIEPGVCGEASSVLDPEFEGSDIESLCKAAGYGAMLHHVAALWRDRYGDSAHSIGPCVAVREDMIRKTREALK